MLKWLKKLFNFKKKRNFDGLEAMFLDEYGCVSYNEEYFDRKYPGYVAMKEDYRQVHVDQFDRATGAAKDFILAVENRNRKGNDKSLETIEGSIGTIFELEEWYRATQLPEDRPMLYINQALNEYHEPIIYFEV